MGIIDTTTFHIHCPSCDKTESVKVHQKGSAYNPYWQDSTESTDFETTWIGGAKKEPRILQAKCRACGTDAAIR